MIAFLKSRRSGKSYSEASSNKTKAQEAEGNDEDKQGDSRLEDELQSNLPNDDPMDQQCTGKKLSMKDVMAVVKVIRVLSNEDVVLSGREVGNQQILSRLLGLEPEK